MRLFNLSVQVEVNFCDKNIPNDPGFTLELSQRMNYEQVRTTKAPIRHQEEKKTLIWLKSFGKQSFHHMPKSSLISVADPNPTYEEKANPHLTIEKVPSISLGKMSIFNILNIKRIVY